VRPENLFSNPYEPFVRVVGDVPTAQSYVPLSEALFGFVPGTWTYRLPQGCFKVRSGPMDVEPSGRLVATLDRMTEADNRFERVRRALAPPPGMTTPIDVYMPTQISLQRVLGKYLPVDRGQGLILDRDEAHSTGRQEDADSARIKVPRSFFSTWVHVEASVNAPVLPLDADEGTIVIEDEGVRTTGEDALKGVHHPLFETLLEMATWHDGLSVTEYTYGISRSYSTAGNDGVEVSFRDRFGEIAIGRTFRTEGLSFTLSKKTFSHVLIQTKEQMKSGQPEWSSSILKAFKALLSTATIGEGRGISTFVLDDIVAVTVSSLGERRRGLRLEDLVGALRALGTKQDELGATARKYYRQQSFSLMTDEESSGGIEAEEDTSAEQERALKLVETITALSESLPDPGPFLELWIRRTLLNTFGIVALTTLQEYSGANDGDVGYAIDPESWGGQGARVFLYDRAAFGNGSAQVAAKYMHIMHILRHGDTLASRLLPTEDFLSLLEEKLMQCPQFHADMSALAMLRPSSSGLHGLRGLKDVEDQAREVHLVAKRTWEALHITGPDDAWWLPIAAVQLDAIAGQTNLALDDLKRSTAICWSGCPECVDRPDSVAGGLLGRNYIDKALLDAWFLSGIQSAEEYIVLRLEDLAQGLVTAGIGTPNKVFLELPQRRVRSCWLPWTLGFQVERTGASPSVRLILRASDVAKLKVSSAQSAGTGFGAGSLGFKRLLWFDLLTTAYMDILGLLPEKRKELKLVYYDCRHQFR
jgi:hypothetical protein